MKKTYLFLMFLFSFSALAQWDYQKIWSTYYFPETTKAYGSVIDNDGNIIVVGSIYRKIYNTNGEFYPSAYYEPYITSNAHQTIFTIITTDLSPSLVLMVRLFGLLFLGVQKTMDFLMLL